MPVESFRINIPERVLVDLRERIEKEPTVISK